jgi:hypothetical protein
MWQLAPFALARFIMQAHAACVGRLSHIAKPTLPAQLTQRRPAYSEYIHTKLNETQCHDKQMIFECLVLHPLLTVYATHDHR